jgi:hypothetical protein
MGGQCSSAYGLMQRKKRLDSGRLDGTPIVSACNDFVISVYEIERWPNAVSAFVVTAQSQSIPRPSRR